MSDKIRWGILGTGLIAGKFATGLAVLPDAELMAVSSRSKETAMEAALRSSVEGRWVTIEGVRGSDGQ